MPVAVRCGARAAMEVLPVTVRVPMVWLPVCTCREPLLTMFTLLVPSESTAWPLSWTVALGSMVI